MSLPVKRRLTLDAIARVTRIGRAEPQARRASHEQSSEAFVAFDTSKLRNAVAIAEMAVGGRGTVSRRDRELDDGDGEAGAQARGKYERLTFCYEAGPTGYGAASADHGLGHECIVVAPSLIPNSRAISEDQPARCGRL